MRDDPTNKPHIGVTNDENFGLWDLIEDVVMLLALILMQNARHVRNDSVLISIADKQFIHVVGALMLKLSQDGFMNRKLSLEGWSQAVLDLLNRHGNRSDQADFSHVYHLDEARTFLYIDSK